MKTKVTQSDDYMRENEQKMLDTNGLRMIVLDRIITHQVIIMKRKFEPFLIKQFMPVLCHHLSVFIKPVLFLNGK